MTENGLGSPPEGQESGTGRAEQVGLGLLARLWPAHPRRWRDVPSRLRPTVLWVLRLTTATVLAFLVSMPLVQGPPDLTGALTALLVVQGTNVGTLRSMVVRIGAVVTGVLLATLVSHFVGLSWWSLAIVVGLALVLAKVFRLGEQSLETGISAMLILAVQGQEIAVENRIFTTLAGAAVGFLFVLLVPPPVPSRRAAHQIRRTATATSNLLTRVAGEMREAPIVRARSRAWLADARALSVDASQAIETVGEAREARRMNPRAIGSSDVGPVLSLGVGTVERVILDVRGLFNVMTREAPREDTPDDGYGEDVRPALAWVLETLADCIAAYGRYVEAEVVDRAGEQEAELEEALEQLGEARAMLADLMTVDPSSERGLWLLRGSILGALHQIVGELETEERRRAARDLARSRELGLLPRAIPGLARPARPTAQRGKRTRRPDGEGWLDPSLNLETTELPAIRDADAPTERG